MDKFQGMNQAKSGFHKVVLVGATNIVHKVNEEENIEKWLVTLQKLQKGIFTTFLFRKPFSILPGTYEQKRLPHSPSLYICLQNLQ